MFDAYSDDTAVEEESLALGEEDSAVCLVGLRSLESGFVSIGVELVAGLCWIEPLESMLFQRVHEDSLSHPETVVKSLQLLVRAQLILRDNSKGAVEVVDAVKQVFCESLESKVLCCLHFALGLLLKVAVLGHLTLPLVLYFNLSIVCRQQYYAPGCKRTVASLASVFAASSSFFAPSSSLASAFSSLAGSADSEYALTPETMRAFCGYATRKDGRPACANLLSKVWEANVLAERAIYF